MTTEHIVLMMSYYRIKIVLSWERHYNLTKNSEKLAVSLGTTVVRTSTTSWHWFLTTLS